MTIPAAFLTSIAQPGVAVDLWVEIEGIPWAFGLTERAASWFAARDTDEERLGVKPVLLGPPSGVDQEARPLDGTSTVGAYEATLVFDAAGEVLRLVAGTARTDYRLVLNEDVAATGAITTLAYTGTPDAAQFPAGGGTFYCGRETFTYTSYAAGTFSGVTRGMYALPGRSATYLHTTGDLITPYPRFIATRTAALITTLDGTDANKVIRWAGTIRGAKTTLRGTALVLSMESVDSDLRATVFAGQRRAKLYAGMKDGAGTYEAASVLEPDPETTKLRIVAESISGDWTNGQTLIVKVEDEFFCGTVASDAVGSYIDVDGRGLFTTTAEQHQPGAELAEAFWTGAYDAAGTAEYRFSKFTAGDHPLEILLALLTSREGDGANGTYDTLPSGWGAGIDQARIDIAGIEALRDKWLPGVRHLWLYTEPFRLSDEIAKILRPHLCFPVSLLGDSLTVRRLNPPIPGDTVEVVGADALTAAPEWNANIADVIGKMIWRCDYDAIADDFRQTFYGEMQGQGTEAQEFYAGQYLTVEVEARGQYTGNDPGAVGFFGAALQTDAKNSSLRYFETLRDRYARPYPKMGIECSYAYLSVNVGDLIYLTVENVPNPDSGGAGLTTVLCEVLAKQVDDARGVVAFTVMRTPATETRLIAPGEPVASTAAGVIRITDTDGALFAAELFSTGDVIEVWTSTLLTSRGTATLTGVTDGGTTLDLAMAAVPAGTTAGDVVMPASYDSATAAQRARWGYLADATPALGTANDPPHRHAI